MHFPATRMQRKQMTVNTTIHFTEGAKPAKHRTQTQTAPGTMPVCEGEFYAKHNIFNKLVRSLVTATKEENGNAPFESET